MNKQTIVILGVVLVIIAAALFLTKEKPANTSDEPGAANTTNQEMNQNEENTPEKTDTSELSEVETGTYSVATEESQVNWQGSKTLIANYEDNGFLSIESGNILVSEDGQVSGNIILDMTTITATSTGRGEGEDGLSRHLKSDDFFSVETFPTAEFTIKSAEKLENSTEGTHMVTGDLTIKGITNEISFPATIKMQDGSLIAQATTSLDRTLWDIRFGSDKFFDNLANNVIDDMFTISFDLVAKK